MRIVIRAVVLASLAGGGVSRAGAPLAESIGDLTSPVPAVRAVAARRLVALADPRARLALQKALADASAPVRREAARALGRLRDARATEPLVKALADPDTNVRFYAAYALGEIKSARAGEALVAALADPQWCVRNQAAWALREIPDPTIAPRLADKLADKDADAEMILWFLRRAPGEAVLAKLAGLLRSPDAEIRRRGITALRAFGGAKATDALLAALAPDAPGAREIVAALLEIHDRRAAEPLARLAAGAKDPALRKAAAGAAALLERHGDLVAYWSFDDRNTRSARDVTGNGNDGQVLGCTPAAGKVGAALRFGPGKYIELGKPEGLPIGQTPFTITAWVKPEKPDGVVVARGGAFCGYSLYIKEGAGKFGIHREESGPGFIAASSAQLGGAWTHLAGVVKKDCIELYVNGKLAARTKTAGYIPGNCGQGMEIGFDVANSPAEITDAFTGLIDEVKAFRAALTAEEIAREFARAGKAGE